MLPDEVREAVETIECWAFRSDEAVIDTEEWQTIKAHLLAREAEVERIRRNLQAYVDNGWTMPAPMIRDLLNGANVYITAHLSENSCGNS